MGFWHDPAELQAQLEAAGSYAALSRKTGVPVTTLKSAGAKHGTATVAPVEQVKWGHGPAKNASASTSEDTELVVFGSDFHFPYQDDAAIASFLNLVKRLKPHRVVLNGDIGDFFQLSRFNKGAQRVRELQEEIDQANEFRAAVRKAAPNARLDEVDGNHDNRIKSYVLTNASALQSLRCLQPEELFKYGDLDISWHPGAGFLLRPNFLVRRGTMVRGEAGASAKAELAQAGISGISGHTHRLSKYIRAGYVQREWTEQGCFSRLDADYVQGMPNWVRGCAIGQFSTRSDSFNVELVQFVDGHLRYGGKSY